MRSGFYNSEIIGYDEEGMPIFDRAEDAEFFANFFKSFFTNGVYPNPSTNFQVLKGTGMNVIVQPGMCFIEGHFGWESESRVLAVQAPNSLDRIDRVVLRLNNMTRAIDLYVLKGIAATVPVAPVLTRPAANESGDIFELALADIFIPKNISSITQDRITDQRLNTALCGIVVQLIKGLDTSAYHAQMNAMLVNNQITFETWVKGLENILGEGDVGSILLEVSKKVENKRNVQGVWSGTQSEYNAVSTKDNNVVYFISEG